MNVEAVLHHLTGLKPVELPAKFPVKLGPAIYYTFDSEHATVANYGTLLETEHQLVVINPTANDLIFDAGELPCPAPMIENYLHDLVLSKDQIPPLMHVLKGMSLKSISETIMLTQARTGGMEPAEVRRTRTLVSGMQQGMYSVDTSVDFYDYPTHLKDWLDLNKDYFLNPKTPHQLVPRGVLLDGSPGVGKSMASKAIANYFGVPLFRLDVATALNKYQGKSEERIFRILNQIEKEAPCVLLIDEIEKIFADSGSDETGVISRILSQLLWWLGDHQTRVITVMTTNKIASIPPELYRPGRIDLTIKIERLTKMAAYSFALKVFESVVGKTPKPNQETILMQFLGEEQTGLFSHAEVAELVYKLIKLFKWL